MVDGVISDVYIISCVLEGEVNTTYNLYPIMESELHSKSAINNKYVLVTLIN